ncbi:cation:proton antiporter regulatory subunit [Georgenia sp. SYP-B2076]|uniref:cation:proton antiporter regulatory subunit n=1 Tax=Georgenia sp. SYP-B2076 TaxID=2495881 RepID=UPI000F8CAF89|nr:TrkA C-terminal domain-containing protein [Georgenia sp. SYP-B2076]
MDLVETLLPGVGIRYELKTSAGPLLGIVVRRDGPVEIVVYEEKDPDRAHAMLHLDPDEADAVADILGAPRLTQRFADISREVPGLRSARLAVRPGSRYAGRPLGATRARTLTGCSIVAVVRDADVVAAPGPDTVLQGGDVLVVLGSEEGLAELDAMLAEHG